MRVYDRWPLRKTVIDLVIIKLASSARIRVHVYRVMLNRTCVDPKSNNCIVKIRQCGIHVSTTGELEVEGNWDRLETRRVPCSS